jgi:hypothetical protein
MRNILFITPSTIKERTGLHANVDEKLVNPEIMTCQDMYIQPTLGSGLYDRLQDGIEDNDLTDLEQGLLDDYITPCLVYYVLSELPVGISFQFYNKGLIRKNGTDQADPSVQDMIDVANRYKARAEFYKERLQRYLKEQSTQGNFNEYLNPGNGIDTIYPEREAYTTSIWLGDDMCCFEGKIDIDHGDRWRCSCGKHL